RAHGALARRHDFADAARRHLALPRRIGIVRAMVRFGNVGLRYGEAGPEVLQGLSFELETGSFHWLLGASGAGKSSLLRLMHLALLVADEPTGNLDVPQARRVLALLQEMHRLGTTVVVATHAESLVGEYPAPALRLAEGRLVSHG